ESPPAHPTFDITGRHLYANAGTYTIHVIVSDGSGHTTTLTTSAVVAGSIHISTDALTPVATADAPHSTPTQQPSSNPAAPLTPMNATSSPLANAMHAFTRRAHTFVSHTHPQRNVSHTARTRLSIGTSSAMGRQPHVTANIHRVSGGPIVVPGAGR